MATSLSSFVDASSSALGMVGDALFSGFSGNTLGPFSSSKNSFGEDSLFTTSSLHDSGFGIGNSSGNVSLIDGGGLGGGTNGSLGRRSENTSTMLQELLQLHSDYEKFVNLTAQAQCSTGGDASYDFANRYKKLHGYIALIVCVFGAIANILIMVVLTRKEMRTPVNHMLLALAIADLLIMIEYIPFALHMYIIDNEPETKYSWAWACFVFFHVHFTQILHTISIQLVSQLWVLFPINIASSLDD
jgi:hypothetical protein